MQITYICKAPEIILEHITPDWFDIPLVYREMIDNQAGLPCDGGGVPGEWCDKGCYWSEKEIDYE